MADLIYPIMQKIEESCKKDEIINIENDQEFYFLVGQCIYYISILKGETKLKNDVYLAIARDNHNPKRYLEKAFQNIIAQKTPIEGNLYTKVYLSLLNYKMPSNIKTADENRFAFMSGYMANNIFFKNTETIK